MSQRSSDYLEKFLELIKPYIVAEKWDECHKAARGYAGGKKSRRRPPIPEDSDTEVSIESIQIGPGPVRREGKFLVAPVHLTHEGVANGILKRWDEIYDPDEVDGVHSFEGCPITRSHPPFGRADESTPTLGRLRNARVDKETKRVDYEAWLVEMRLTGNEITALESGQPVPGSIGYLSRKKYYDLPQVWEDGSTYTEEVLRPLIGDHYALLNGTEDPACPSCGFNPRKETATEQAVTETEPITMIPNCPKKTPAPLPEHGVSNMETESTPAIKPDMNIEALLTEGLEKATAPLLEKIAALEKRVETYEAEAAANAKRAEETLDIERKAAFGKMIKPAFAADIETHYANAKAMGESLWFSKNPDKLQVHVESKGVMGKSHTHIPGSTVQEARRRMIESRNKALGIETAGGR